MTIVTSIIAFYLPVLVLIYLYRGIYKETQKCQKYLPAFTINGDCQQISNTQTKMDLLEVMRVIKYDR